MYESKFNVLRRFFLEAFSIIKDKDKWCKRAEALDENSWIVSYNDPTACKWCSLGAINKVDTDLYGEYRNKSLGFPFGLFEDFVYKTTGLHIMSYNDSPKTTHDDIVKLWEDFGKSQKYL